MEKLLYGIIKNYSGHLTIMKYTTGWKVMLGTPELSKPDGYEEVWLLKNHNSIESALAFLIDEIHKERKKQL